MAGAPDFRTAYVLSGLWLGREVDDAAQHGEGDVDNSISTKASCQRPARLLIREDTTRARYQLTVCEQIDVARIDGRYEPRSPLLALHPDHHEATPRV